VPPVRYFPAGLDAAAASSVDAVANRHIHAARRPPSDR